MASPAGRSFRGTGGGGGGGGNTNTSSDPHGSVPHPRYRSATEQRMCEEVMKREGTWDEATGAFRTRESVLQQRTQLITGLQQTLRVSPKLQYKEQSSDKNAEYPHCPVSLLRTSRIRAADLGITDPKPENVERCMSTAMARRSRAVKLPPSRVGSDEVLGQLEEVLLEEAHAALARMGASEYTDDDTRSDAGRSVNASLYAVGPAGSGMSAARSHRAPHHSTMGVHGGNATPALHSSPPPGAGGPSATPLPVPAGSDGDGGYLADVGAAGPNQYSSLLMELRLTKQTAQDRKKKHSALQAILDMDGSADLKRTITRMFADPKNAERISSEEAQRREARYAEDKQAQIRQQTRLLAEERALMDKELAQLK